MNMDTSESVSDILADIINNKAGWHFYTGNDGQGKTGWDSDDE